MTTTHLQLEVEKIKEEILKMGGLVEEALDKATRALSRRDADLAREVIKKDPRINELENVIDDHCVRIIATQQPVATDLRFLTAAMKMCTILERSGDQAVNIADRTLALVDMVPAEPFPPTLLEMGELAQDMTRMCLDAFVRRDTSLAYEVCDLDDRMDELNRQLLEEMITWMMKEQRVIRRGVEYVLAGRHYERVGDQATNVSEEVVYMVRGTVIRHQDVCNPPDKKE